MKLEGSGPQPKIERVEIFSNSGIISFNIADSFEFFTTLGCGNFNIKTPLDVAGLSPIVEIRSGTDFAWGFGIRWAMFRRKCLAFGVEIAVAGMQTPIQSISVTELTSVYPDDARAKYDDWQIGAGFSYHISRLIPYASVTYSRSKIRFDLDEAEIIDPFNIVERFSWGYALGVTIPSGRRSSVTVEGRFRDEAALNVVAEIRF